MFKKWIIIASLVAIVATSSTFAWSLKDLTTQHKEAVAQHRESFKTKREEIKVNYQNAKVNYKAEKSPAKNDLKTLMKTLDKATFSGVKAQVNLMNQEIKTIHKIYKDNWSGWLLKMHDEITVIKDKYYAIIKSLLPIEKQEEYQKLIDSLNSINDSYITKLQNRKDELVTNRNNRFDSKTQLIQTRFDNIIKTRLDQLKTKSEASYQAFVTQLEKSINKLIDSVNNMKNISEDNKKSRLDLYSAILDSLDQSENTVNQESIIVENPLTEAVQ